MGTKMFHQKKISAEQLTLALKKLPHETQIRLFYMIEGALLVEDVEKEQREEWRNEIAQ